MAKLYEATVEITVYVQAEDAREAADEALRAFEEEVRNLSSYDVHAVEVTRRAWPLAEQWSRNCLVYGGHDDDTMLGDMLDALPEES